MSAVIRIKRHITEEPQHILTLNCKRPRTELSGESQSGSSETSTILKFAGTVHQATNTHEHIAKLTKDEAKEIVGRKKLEASRIQSRRDDHRLKSQQNRFKVVNFTRNDKKESDESSSDVPLTIVDVEKDRITPQTSTSAVSNNEQGASSSFSDIPDDPYVYDIYIAENSNALHQESLDVNDLSILDFEDPLYSQVRMTKDSDEDDDDDSNDENNWRNDYPDDEEMSEDDESIGERQMRRAMNDLELGNELSSDEGDENGFVYSIDAEGFNFEDDLDYGDVDRHGEAYARYRRRVVKEMQAYYDDGDGKESNSSYGDTYDDVESD